MGKELSMRWNNVEPVSEIKKIIAKPQVNFKSPWYARAVIRKISVYVTWLLLHTDISANQVTLVQNVLGFIGFFLLCSSHVGWAFLGVLIIQFGYVLDCVDGEIARYRKTPSVNGLFMDVFNHVSVIPLIPAGLGFHYYHVSGNYLLYPILGVLGGLFCMSPTNLAAKDTLILLMERRKAPAYDYRGFEKEGDRDLDPSSKQGGKSHFVKKIIIRAVNYWGFLAHYPGSMNVISILVLVELFLGRASVGILCCLFIFYVGMTILREFFHFYRSVQKNEVEHRYLQLYTGLQEKRESSINVPAD